MRTALLLAFVFAALPALSQPTLGVGARLGGNVSILTDGFEGISSDREAGAAAALLVVVAFSDQTALVAEAGYAFLRYSHTLPFQPDTSPNSTGGEITFTSTQRMIQMGMLGKANLPLSGTLSPYLLLGPQVGLLLETDIDTAPAELNGSPIMPDRVDHSEPYNDVTLNGVVGLGIGLATAGTDLRIEVRYERTLTGFLASGGGTLSSFGLSLGATF